MNIEPNKNNNRNNSLDGELLHGFSIARYDNISTMLVLISVSMVIYQ